MGSSGWDGQTDVSVVGAAMTDEDGTLKLDDLGRGTIASEEEADQRY